MFKYSTHSIIVILNKRGDVIYKSSCPNHNNYHEMGEGEERLKSVKGKDWACLKKLTSPNRKKTPMMRKQKPINAL